MIFNLMDPEFRQDPRDFFRRLRAEGPVNQAAGMTRWAVSTWEEVQQVLKQPLLYSSRGWVRDKDLVPELENDLPKTESMVFLDPPRHTRLRKIVAPVFSERRIRGFEDRVQASVDELLAHLQRQENPEFVRDFSMPLPMRVIADMLGIESARYEDFKRWTDLTTMLIQFMGLTGAARQERIEATRQAEKEFSAYIYAAVRDRRAAPRDDLLSLIAAAKVDGDSLSMEECYAMAKLLLFAGNETTQNMMGNIMILFSQQPHWIDELRRDPSLADNFVAEALRFDPPVYGAPRELTKDTELAGTTLRKGEKVFALTASANHDEAVFPDPDRFDPTRDHSRSIPYGSGVHTCLGMHLANLELRIAVQGLVEILPEMDIGEFAWSPSILIRGPEYIRMSRRPSRTTISLPASDNESAPSSEVPAP